MGTARQPSVPCGAHARSTGLPCVQPVQPGSRCRFHGGATPQAKRAAQRRAAEAAAAEAVRTYGLPLDVSPTDALLNEVRWTAGHVAWLRERVQELEHAALVWGMTEQVDKGAGEFTGTDTTEAAKPNVWLTLYQQERAHLVSVCKTAIQVGIEERRVKLAEAQGEVVAGVIRAILGELGLSADQAARAPEIASRHLRLVANTA